MAQLKAVIFGITDVLAKDGSSASDSTQAEIGRLVRFLHQRGIECIALGNRDWELVDSKTKERQPLRDYLNKLWDVNIQWVIKGQNGFNAAKQSAESLKQIREQHGWEPNETLYIGNSEVDMQAAVNGGTLFLNALWHGDNCEYGFRFSSPKDICRFIDIFCLREHWWYFTIQDGDLEVYALAPYSTYAVESFKLHSENFIRTVKRKQGDVEEVGFWAKYMCTSLYFSGVYKDISYITPYPGHKVGTMPSVLEAPMAVFAKCFRGKFLPDLILRHQDSIESKTNRDSVNHENQLNTIVLNPKPEKAPGDRYKNPPLARGKTVLVVDDILTCGYSFEAARNFISQTRARTICVGFLKTLKRDYHSLSQFKLSGGAYRAHQFQDAKTKKTYGYNAHIVDYDAAAELKAKLELYPDWNWPNK